MAETLTVVIREGRGKREAKRLRKTGSIPAILYGHGEQNVSLSVAQEQFAAALRHHSRLVDLTGAVNESALIRDMQWDTYGLEVLHVDFARVSADERIDVNVSVELRGQAPGLKEGGVIQHMLHELQIECLAVAIPDRIQVSLSKLNKGEHILAGQIELPPGVKLLSDPEQIVVHCVEPAAEVETEAGAESAEPEVIGRKADEDEDSDS